VAETRLRSSAARSTEAETVWLWIGEVASHHVASHLSAVIQDLIIRGVYRPAGSAEPGPRFAGQSSEGRPGGGA